MDLVTVLILLLLLTLGVIFALPKFLIMIPPKRFAIVERIGAFNRILSSGPNLLIWPIDSLKELSWECPVKKITGTMGSLENIQLDIKPISCITNDMAKVTVDGTLFFIIKSPHIAVYESEDALNQLYQVATQSVRNVVGSVNSNLLNGKDEFIGKSIVKSINDIIEKSGLSVRSVIIQNVLMDQVVEETNQVRFTLDSKLAMQEREHDYQLREAKHRAELQRIEIEASGLLPEQRIRMEFAKSIAKIPHLIVTSDFLRTWRESAEIEERAIPASLNKYE